MVVDRIFSGAVCTNPNRGQPVEDIGLAEFTQFLLAEEDKTHPTRFVLQISQQKIIKINISVSNTGSESWI